MVLDDMAANIKSTGLAEGFSSEISGYHGLRTRRSGRERYIDLHLVVDPRKRLGEVHSLCDRIEEEVGRELSGAVVTIHAEPDDGRDLGPEGPSRGPEGRARRFWDKGPGHE